MSSRPQSGRPPTAPHQPSPRVAPNNSSIPPRGIHTPTIPTAANHTAASSSAASGFGTVPQPSFSPQRLTVRYSDGSTSRQRGMRRQSVEGDPLMMLLTGAGRVDSSPSHVLARKGEQFPSSHHQRSPVRASRNGALSSASAQPLSPRQNSKKSTAAKTHRVIGGRPPAHSANNSNIFLPSTSRNTVPPIPLFKTSADVSGAAPSVHHSHRSFFPRCADGGSSSHHPVAFISPRSGIHDAANGKPPQLTIAAPSQDWAFDVQPIPLSPRCFGHDSKIASKYVEYPNSPTATRGFPSSSSSAGAIIAAASSEEGVDGSSPQQRRLIAAPHDTQRRQSSASEGGLGLGGRRRWSSSQRSGNGNEGCDDIFDDADKGAEPEGGAGAANVDSSGIITTLPKNPLMTALAEALGDRHPCPKDPMSLARQFGETDPKQAANEKLFEAIANSQWRRRRLFSASQQRRASTPTAREDCGALIAPHRPSPPPLPSSALQQQQQQLEYPTLPISRPDRDRFEHPRRMSLLLESGIVRRGVPCKVNYVVNANNELIDATEDEGNHHNAAIITRSGEQSEGATAPMQTASGGHHGGILMLKDDDEEDDDGDGGGTGHSFPPTAGTLPLRPDGAADPDVDDLRSYSRNTNAKNGRRRSSNASSSTPPEMYRPWSRLSRDVIATTAPPRAMQRMAYEKQQRGCVMTDLTLEEESGGQGMSVAAGESLRMLRNQNKKGGRGGGDDGADCSSNEGTDNGGKLTRQLSILRRHTLQQSHTVSPTRRRGRVVMMDQRIGGLLFDEGSTTVIPFSLGQSGDDHVSAAFAVSDWVYYQRRIETETGAAKAIRMMIDYNRQNQPLKPLPPAEGENGNDRDEKALTTAFGPISTRRISSPSSPTRGGVGGPMAFNDVSRAFSGDGSICAPDGDVEEVRGASGLVAAHNPNANGGGLGVGGLNTSATLRSPFGSTRAPLDLHDAVGEGDSGGAFTTNNTKNGPRDLMRALCEVADEYNTNTVVDGMQVAAASLVPHIDVGSASTEYFYSYQKHLRAILAEEAERVGQPSRSPHRHQNISTVPTLAGAASNTCTSGGPQEPARGLIPRPPPLLSIQLSSVKTGDDDAPSPPPDRLSDRLAAALMAEAEDPLAFLPDVEGLSEDGTLDDGDADGVEGEGAVLLPETSKLLQRQAIGRFKTTTTMAASSNRGGNSNSSSHTNGRGGKACATITAAYYKLPDGSPRRHFNQPSAPLKVSEAEVQRWLSIKPAQSEGAAKRAAGYGVEWYRSPRDWAPLAEQKRQSFDSKFGPPPPPAVSTSPPRLKPQSAGPRRSGSRK